MKIELTSTQFEQLHGEPVRMCKRIETFAFRLQGVDTSTIASHNLFTFLSETCRQLVVVAVFDQETAIGRLERLIASSAQEPVRELLRATIVAIREAAQP
jgi:hypothetical protein